MLPEHHIEWIVLDTGEKTEIVYLKPDMEPKTEFADISSGTVYGYCNLHGLWKADFYILLRKRELSAVRYCCILLDNY